MRIQTTRDSASTFISGIHFAAHPNPPQGGRLLVSEDVDPDAEGVAGLLSLPGFEQAPAYADDVLDAIDDAIGREKNSAQTAATAEVHQTVAELQAANQNLSAKVAQKDATIKDLERQIGETAVGELRDEIARLQARLKDGDGGGGDAARVSELEAENATLRSRNETIGTENQTLRAELEAAKADAGRLEAEKAKLAGDLKAAQDLLDADDKPAADAAGAEGATDGAATGKKKGGKSN